MNLEELKVLIVEDEAVIAADIRSLLRSEGCGIAGVAYSASKAYDLLSSSQPNFVVLDIYLGPGDSGIDIAEVIHEKYKIPYIFLTSFSDELTVSAAQEHGPYGYIVKPYQDRTLLTTLSVAWANYKKTLSQNSWNMDRLPTPLSNQEKNICRLLCDGHSYKQICANLHISMNTLKYHVKNIYTKCDVSGRAELIPLFLQS